MFKEVLIEEWFPPSSAAGEGITYNNGNNHNNANDNGNTNQSSNSHEFTAAPPQVRGRRSMFLRLMRRSAMMPWGGDDNIS